MGNAYTYKDALKMADPSSKLYDQFLAVEDYIGFDSSFKPLLQITYEVTDGSATMKIFDANAPFGFEIVDTVIQCRNTSTNGTLKLTNGSNDISDAMTCATDTNIVRAGTIDDAYSTISKSGTLQVVGAGDAAANTKGLVTVYIRKV